MATYEGSDGWKRFVQRMMGSLHEIRPAMRGAITEATNVTHAASKQNLNRMIYSKPEDRTTYSFRRGKKPAGGGSVPFRTDKSGNRIKYGYIVKGTGEDARLVTKDLSKLTGEEDYRGGKKKWTRTGNLRRSEKKYILEDYKGLIENTAGYAIHRHDLGLPVGDPRAIRGRKRGLTKRIAPFRTDAVMATAGQRRKIMADSLRVAMDMVGPAPQ